MSNSDTRHGQSRFLDFSEDEKTCADLVRQTLAPAMCPDEAAARLMTALRQSDVISGGRRGSRFVSVRRVGSTLSAAAALLLIAALLSMALRSRSALAHVIDLIKTARTFVIEVEQRKWVEGRDAPARVDRGKIWVHGDRQFHQLGDRRQWVFKDKTITYFPEANRVAIGKTKPESIGPADGFSRDAIVKKLEDLGLSKLPEERETIDGRDYVVIRMALPQDSGMEMAWFIDRQEMRLDYLGYRFTDGLHKGRFAVWMKWVYDPEIDEKVFVPAYPQDAKVVVEGVRERTEDVLRRWRPLALVTGESNHLEVGVLEVWLAPDGLLGVHVYESRVWPSGSAFPDEPFTEAEMKGGFSRKQWSNVNALLEAPTGEARRQLRNPPLSRRFFRCPGKGPTLSEHYYYFRVPKASDIALPKPFVLHIWKLREPLSAFGWVRGYREKKENYAYLTLELPVPETPSETPSQRFIAGLAQGDRRHLEAIKLRLWLLERNEGAEGALRLLNDQPMGTQHALAWKKLGLMKALGRQREINEFLQIHIPWRRANDQRHKINIPNLLKTFGDGTVEARE